MSSACVGCLPAQAVSAILGSLENTVMDKKKAPKGLLGFLLVLGPSLIWCGEYIGSGEVILATRAGAIFGTMIMWVIVVGIFFKYWIGLCGARYTVVTGEGMVDMFTRVPGPKNWLIYLVLVGQTVAGIFSIGALLTAATAFLQELIPLHTFIWGSLVVVFTFTVTWSGRFSLLKYIMSALVAVIVIGVLYVAVQCLPGISEMIEGLFGFKVPEIPEWVTEKDPKIVSKWKVVLPLLGWAAGGFASQVWYTYWVLGAGYGMAKDRQIGQRADEAKLKHLSKEEAEEVKPWLKIVAWDATVALIIGTTVTLAFLISGSGVLGENRVVPTDDKTEFVKTLSTVFSSRWSAVGGTLFILAGAAAMISTQLGQLAGWPRLLADCVKNISRRFARFSSVKQFRVFLLMFLVTNLLLLQVERPILLVTISAVTDGLLLVPVQALAVLWVLFVEQKKMLSQEAWDVLKPKWYHAAGLVLSFLIFGYFFIFQVPGVIAELIKGLTQ